MKKIMSIFLLLFSIIGCRNSNSNSNKKFTWEVQKSGPKDYPMEILSGTLYFKGEERGVSIPRGTSYGKWGSGFANHPEVHYTLPDCMEVEFYSYAENQVYRGLFNLPYDDLLKQFQWGVDNPIKRFNMELFHFNKFVIGVAPGGSVGVWISGAGEQREVFFGKAEKVETNLSWVFEIPFRTETEAERFRVKVLRADVGEEQFKNIQENGVPFDIWERYRNHYNWVIEGVNGIHLERLRATHINGLRKSQEYYYYKRQYLPIPDYISFSFGSYYQVYLDDYETIEAFDTLNAIEGLNSEERLIHIEVSPRLPMNDTIIRIYNAKKSIELKKVLCK